MDGVALTPGTQLALEVMCEVGLKRLEQPDFTASARAGVPSLIIMSEGLVPETYWVPQPPKLDRQAMLAEHLRFVAGPPCLICGRTPAHAHHIRYAQAKGIALKVSDQFTVPLCAIHHSENHFTGDRETMVAGAHNDPLAIAQSLWRENSGIEREQCKLSQVA